MASLDDVRRLAMALPEVTERASYGGTASWRVKDKAFVWERPLRPADLAALGDEAPRGDVLGVRVGDEGVKLAMIADDPATYFTIPHFIGYPAVLVRLDVIGLEELEEIVVEAWLDRAPKRLAASYRAD